MKYTAITGALLLSLPASLVAQIAEIPAPLEAVPAVNPPAAEPMPPKMLAFALPANTEIAVTPVASVSSKKLKKGDSFAIEIIADVMHQGYVVMPRGTKGQATITKRSGTGVFGRSGKLEYSVDWIELADGRKLLVNGKFDQDGKQNLTALAGGMFLAGLVGGLLVTGRSAEVPAGHILYVRTAEGVAYTVPADAQPLSVVTLLPRPERPTLSSTASPTAP
jgi:hypothetical protein